MDADDSIKTLRPKAIAKKILDGVYTLSDRQCRSKVWEVFSRIVDEHGVEITEFVYCKFCERVFRFNKITSNLVKHKCVIERVPIKSDITINENTVVEAETVEENTFEISNNNLTKLITKWMIKDCRTYDIIQSDGLRTIFQKFAMLGSTFDGEIDVEQLLPTETAVGENVTEMYLECFRRVKAEIASIEEHAFGLTSNIWSDSSLKKSFVAVTIHFLKNGTLTYRLLGLRAVDGECCTSENMYEKIEQILKDFDCELSATSIIVTNVSKDFITSFQNSNQNVPCISHLLNNAISKAVESVPEVTKLLNVCARLSNRLKRLPLDPMLMASLENYCPSRWNTTNKMLKSLESNWAKVEKFLYNDNHSDEEIKTINSDDLKDVYKTLQPFEDAIETLEEDNSPTIHLVLMYLHELKKSCSSTDSGCKNLDLIGRLKEILQFHLEIIVAESITTLHKLALFLYPPTKRLLQFSDSEKTCIEEECLRLMKCYNDETNPKIKEEPETPESKRRKLFEDFVENEKSCDPNEIIIKELTFYKTTRVLNCSNFDAFSWWELQKDNFPLLFKLSRTVLLTPASSAASQRVFYDAGSLLRENNRDFCLEETELDQIMFVHCNNNNEKAEIEN